MADELARLRAALRTALADYIASEGCDCCRGSDHDAHEAQLGRLLRVPRYQDGSGFDWRRYRTKEVTRG